MNLTLLGLIVGAVSGALVAREKFGRRKKEDSGTGEVQPPSTRAGRDFLVRVQPDGDSLKFTQADGSDASTLFIDASTSKATNSLTWEFDFPEQYVIASQVLFEGGTPLFRAVNLERGRITDDTAGLGRTWIRKSIKEEGVADPTLGLTEIIAGDEFKYSVIVVARSGETLRAFAADPIVIVRNY